MPWEPNHETPCHLSSREATWAQRRSKESVARILYPMNGAILVE